MEEVKKFRDDSISVPIKVRLETRESLKALAIGFGDTYDSIISRLISEKRR
jgi:hypothetical protein